MRTNADRKLLEDGIDGAAAAIFAAAVAFGLAKLAPQLGAAAVGVSMFAFAGCWAVLKRVPNERLLPLPAFQPAEFVGDLARDELILTLEQIYAPAEGPEPGDELLLDDILGALGPDSRVVRLFAQDGMPTPGQLKSSIDRHLQSRRTPPSAPDASNALSDALAELRRSLR